jgi:hypothetical protein
MLNFILKGLILKIQQFEAKYQKVNISLKPSIKGVTYKESIMNYHKCKRKRASQWEGASKRNKASKKNKDSKRKRVSQRKKASKRKRANKWKRVNKRKRANKRKISRMSKRANKRRRTSKRKRACKKKNQRNDFMIIFELFNHSLLTCSF